MGSHKLYDIETLTLYHKKERLTIESTSLFIYFSLHSIL